MPFFFFFHFTGNLNNDFRYNAGFLVQGDLSHLSVHFLCICSTRLYDPLMRLLVFLFHFKVLQNVTWFGLTGLKGNVISYQKLVHRVSSGVSNIEKQFLLFRGVRSP